MTHESVFMDVPGSCKEPAARPSEGVNHQVIKRASLIPGSGDTPAFPSIINNCTGHVTPLIYQIAS